MKEFIKNKIIAFLGLKNLKTYAKEMQDLRDNLEHLESDFRELKHEFNQMTEGYMLDVKLRKE